MDNNDNRPTRPIFSMWDLYTLRWQWEFITDRTPAGNTLVPTVIAYILAGIFCIYFHNLESTPSDYEKSIIAAKQSQETVQAPVFQPYWYTDANGNTYLVNK